MKTSMLRNKFLHDRTKISRKDKKTTKHLWNPYQKKTKKKILQLLT